MSTFLVNFIVKDGKIMIIMRSWPMTGYEEEREEEVMTKPALSSSYCAFWPRLFALALKSCLLIVPE